MTDSTTTNTLRNLSSHEADRYALPVFGVLLLSFGALNLVEVFTPLWDGLIIPRFGWINWLLLLPAVQLIYRCCRSVRLLSGDLVILCAAIAVANLLIVFQIGTVPFGMHTFHDSVSTAYAYSVSPGTASAVGIFTLTRMGRRKSVSSLDDRRS